MSSEPNATTETSEPAVPTLTIGAGSPGAAEAESLFRPVIRGKLDRFGVAMGTGRRKTAVARVRIKTGSGGFSINGRAL